MSVSKEQIENEVIYSEKYKVFGKWKLKDMKCILAFLYDGQLVQLPFNVSFTEKTLPWLVEAAILKIENYIEDVLFNKRSLLMGGSYWDE